MPWSAKPCSETGLLQRRDSRAKVQICLESCQLSYVQLVLVVTGGDSMDAWTERKAVRRQLSTEDFHVVQDIVMVIYTVSYPPRLVPISLLLPGDDSLKPALAAASTAQSPAAAVAANASKTAVAANAAATANGTAGNAVTGRRLLSPITALALGNLAFTQGSRAHHVAALENEGYLHVPHKPGCAFILG